MCILEATKLPCLEDAGLSESSSSSSRPSGKAHAWPGVGVEAVALPSRTFATIGGARRGSVLPLGVARWLGDRARLPFGLEIPRCCWRVDTNDAWERLLPPSYGELGPKASPPMFTLTRLSTLLRRESRKEVAPPSMDDAIEARWPESYGEVNAGSTMF